jgi:hypothetical protein
MEENALPDQPTYERIIRELHILDKRLTHIEESLEGSEYDLFRARHAMRDGSLQSQAVHTPAEKAEIDEELESKFGEYVLPWLGNIVFLFGIGFLMQYFSRKGSAMNSAVIGFIVVAAVFAIAYFIRKSLSYLSFMFQLTAHLLLYYTTLRLHFFSSQVLVQDKLIVSFLLLGLIAIQIRFALRRKSEMVACIAIILSIATALFSDIAHFMMPVLVITTGLAVYFMSRFLWWRLLVITILLVYSSMLLWLAGNPAVGHPVMLIREPQNTLVYLFLVAALFSSVALLPKKGADGEIMITPAIMLNGLFFSILMALYIVSFYPTNYGIIITPVSLFCLGFAILLKKRSSSEYITAFFALYAFMVISVNLYGFFHFPKVYLLLSLQSLLVVSIALWFRSKIIVVMNTILFIILLIAYLLGPDRLDAINFTYAIVALITARVLNWQKARLEIKSEMLRNTYLMTAFFMMLYALFMAVPSAFVTLSWIIAACVYFLLSILMRNVKYRYMAMGTMIATAFYLFLVDLAKVDLVVRIFAFLFLSILSIAISVFYVRRMKGKQTAEAAMDHSPDR